MSTHSRMSCAVAVLVLAILPLASLPVRAQTEMLSGFVDAHLSTDPVETDEGTLWSVVLRVSGQSSSSCVPHFEELTIEGDHIRIDSLWPFAAPCILEETDYEFFTPGRELLSGVYTVELWFEDSFVSTQQVPIYDVDGFVLGTEPDRPVETEPFRFSIAGQWSDSCVPAPGDVQQVDDRGLLVRGLTAPCDVGCLSAISPYQFETAPFGPLDAGIWSVEYRVVTCTGEVVIGSREIEVQPALGLPGCQDSQDVLCVDGRADGDRRFQVEVDYNTDRFGGTAGQGTVIPPSDATIRGGLFWFFDETNPEMLVKVLDGCGVNRHWWVFVSALTDVEYTVVVTDTESGEEWVTTNDDHHLAEPVADTRAFACQPPFGEN